MSVVIPRYGRPQFLALTLESLARQTNAPEKVIVADDCSPEPVRLAAEHGLPITVLRHLRNQGP